MNKTIVRTYKKNDPFSRAVDAKLLKLRGYSPIKEEEVTGYNAGKGILLGLFFLPLALFGFGKRIKITYGN
jgi:hypothetical protein